MCMDSAQLLSTGGLVARRLPNYEPRPQPLAMARSVAEAFDRPAHLLVEAGTGVGKSFAYLLPAIERVIRHDERVVVSTHTIALQAAHQQGSAVPASGSAGEVLGGAGERSIELP